MLLRARTVLLASPAQQDHVLQRCEEHAAVHLTDAIKKKKKKISGVSNVAKRYGSMYSFYGLVVSFAGRRVASPFCWGCCLERVLGKELRSVGYPWLVRVLSVVLLCHVCVPGMLDAWTAGPCSSISVAPRSCDLSGNDTAACQMCAGFYWNMWLKR